MRHSRFVRLLRVAIPVSVIAGLLAVVAAATILDPLRLLAKLPVKIDGLVVSGSKITMHRPRLAGFTQDKRPYVLVANAAARDATRPDVLELQELHATIEMKDSSQLEVTAKTGIYKSKADKLSLYQDVLVNMATSQAKMSEAVMNIRANHIVSEKPVEVTMTQGTINANRLEVFNSGSIIRFERGVTMLLTGDPSKQEPESK